MRTVAIGLAWGLGLALTAACSPSRGTPPNLAAPMILTVEPPSWWANPALGTPRLLIRGKNLQSAVVRPARAGVRPGEPRINARGTALFVDLRIAPDAAPGDYPLVLSTPSGEAKVVFRVDAEMDRNQHFRGISRDDVVYLIMPDRFCDGDPSNNVPPGSDPKAFDRKLGRGFHGGDIQGVINRLPYLKDLGVTALWLNPWYDNANDLVGCDHPWCPYTAYHGYFPTDFYGVEDHFGSLATVRKLVETAHRMGLKVIQDQVPNHVGGQHAWAADPPLPTWFHGTRTAHLQNVFRIDQLVSPHAHGTARAANLEGWYTDDMPDLNQGEPELARYLVQNAVWWVGATGIDGIRLDSAPYVPRAFLRDLTSAVHRAYPRAWVVAEILDLDPIHTSFYMGGRPGWDEVDTGLDSVFDFPLWSASVNVFRGNMPATAIANTLRADLLYPDHSRLTTLTGNHDLPRFLSFKDATLHGALLHTAFILSARGIPQLDYGDEIAMPGGDDPDNRRDFPGGFPGDPADAFSALGRSADQDRAFTWTRAWIRLRREHSAIRRGQMVDLAADADTLAFARRDDRETLVIAFNRSGVPRTLSFPAEAIGAAAGAKLVPLLGEAAGLTVTDGTVAPVLPPRSATAFVLSR